MYTQLDADLITIAKTRILGGVWVGNTPPDRLKHLGNYAEDTTISYETEESEAEWNNTRTRSVARTDITKKTGTVSLTLNQLTEFAKAAMYMAKTRSYTQAAAVGLTKEYDNVEVGDIFETGYKDITAFSLVDVLDEDAVYGILSDPATGRIEVTSVPADSEGAVLTFSAPAITADAKRTEYGILSSEGVTMTLVFRQLHEGADDIVIPKVTLKADGDVVIGATGTDYSSVTLTGTILSDSTQPPERRMGYAVTVGGLDV